MRTFSTNLSESVSVTTRIFFSCLAEHGPGAARSSSGYCTNVSGWTYLYSATEFFPLEKSYCPKRIYKSRTREAALKEYFSFSLHVYRYLTVFVRLFPLTEHPAVAT